MRVWPVKIRPIFVRWPQKHDTKITVTPNHEKVCILNKDKMNYHV